VVDAHSLELLETEQGELAVADAGRDQDRPAADLLPALEPDDVMPLAPVERCRLCRDADAGAELLRLDDRPLRELGAGDRRDAQPAEQGLRLLVLLQVDEPVRQPVAGGELPQPSRVRRVPRAHDSEARPELDQDRPAEQVGPQDQVPEHGVPRDELAQALDRHDEHLAGLHHLRGDERGLAGEQVELAHEAAGAVGTEHALLLAPAPLEDRHQAFQDHDEVVVRVALPVQHVAGEGAPPLALLGEGLDLRVVEPRVRPVAVGRLGQRRRPCRLHRFHPAPPSWSRPPPWRPAAAAGGGRPHPCAGC